MTVIVFIAFAAVPTLSMISGILFFKDASPHRAPDLIAKWRARSKSLGVPFVLWSSATVTAFAVAAELLPGLAGDLTVFDGGTPRDVAEALFGLTRSPFVGQFWFVRDLIVTVAFAPAIWFLVGRAPVLTLSAIAVLWVSGQTLGVFLRLDCLMFFSLGAAFALHRVRPDLRPGETLMLLGLFAALVAARTFLPWATGMGRDAEVIVLVTAALRFVGAIVAWNLGAMMARSSVGQRVATFGAISFFVFCAHSPLILVVKQVVGGAVAPMSSATHLAVYFLTVGVTLAIVTVAASVLRSRWPRLFATLNGGRS